MKTIEKKACEILASVRKKSEEDAQRNLDYALSDEKFKKLYLEERKCVVELSKKEFESGKCSRGEHDIIVKKINARLKEMKLSSSDLIPKIYCKICKDKGFVNSKPCVCLKSIISQLLIEESGIKLKLEEFEKCDFSLFDNRKEIEKIYSLMQAWCDKFRTSEILNWGIFGNTGTGKTHLLLCTADRLIKNGTYIYFSTAFNMIKDLLAEHTTFDKNKEQIISKYLDCEVLFIDDLGTEPIYNNVNENYLYLIVNQRTVEKKPVIFSTNLTMDEFYNRYGERIFSRLANKKHSKLLLLEGNDVRLKKDKI